MDFEFNGIKYFVHRYYKDCYHLANFVYYKDGDLVFIDYINEDIHKTVELFKIFSNR